MTTGNFSILNPNIIARYKYQPTYHNKCMVTSHVLVWAREEFSKYGHFTDKEGTVPECDIVAVRTAPSQWHFELDEQEALLQQGQLSLGL